MGLIVWLILIFIIACCACPGFLGFLFTVIGIAFGILVLGVVVVQLIKK